MNTQSKDAPTDPKESSKNKDLLIGVAICAVAAALIVGVVVFARQQTKLVYQPLKACELLTANEAGLLLGSQAINGTKSEPQLSGNTAISKCAYSDSNQDMNKMIVAALTVRSGINDNGKTQNTSEFTIAAKGNEVESVEGIGDAAFFNSSRGQLNVLKDEQWFIISYGTGLAPETNTLDKTVELARLALS